MKTCPKCGTEHDKTGVFCSRSCANSRIRTEEFKKTISDKLTGRKTGPSPIKGTHRVEVIVLRKDQLQKEFTYVTKTYTKDFASLYDGYKPKYSYVCECCGKSFERKYKIDAKHIACSRSCSLKMNRQVSGKNQYTSRDAASVASSPSNC